MSGYKVDFDATEWTNPRPGARFKLATNGTRQMRLVEFTPAMSHPEWCLVGHSGIVKPTPVRSYLFSVRSPLVSKSDNDPIHSLDIQVNRRSIPPRGTIDNTVATPRFILTYYTRVE